MSWESKQAERGLPCPECGDQRSATIDTRPSRDAIRRRRLCPNGHRYTTYERAAGVSANPALARPLAKALLLRIDEVMR